MCSYTLAILTLQELSNFIANVWKEDMGITLLHNAYSFFSRDRTDAFDDKRKYVKEMNDAKPTLDTFDCKEFQVHSQKYL